MARKTRKERNAKRKEGWKQFKQELSNEANMVANTFGGAIKEGFKGKNLVDGVKRGVGHALGEAVSSIPRGIGSFANKVKAVGKMLFNDPKWYENVDMHVAYKLPFNFTNDQGLQIGGVTARTLDFAVVNCYYNPNPTRSDKLSRFTQILDLLKGVRGLSGVLPYDANDLKRYWDTVLGVINEYGRLKFCLKAARYYQMTKKSLPSTLLNQLGFSTADFIANRANYVGILTDMANFISNNLPVTGYIVDKVYHSWDALIPDMNDGDITAYFKVNLNVTGNYQERVFGPCFQNDVNTRTSYFGTPSIKFDDYFANYQTVKTGILNTQKFSAIKADMIGAFGTSVVWMDNSISEVDLVSPDITGGMDELFLTMLQNATLCAHRDSVIIDRSGASKLISYLEPDTMALDLGFIADAGLKSTIVATSSGIVRPTDSIVHLFVPPNDGIAGGIGQSSESDTDVKVVDKTTINANEYYSTSGEMIEIQQLTSWAVNFTVDRNEDIVTSAIEFETHEFFVGSIDLISEGGPSAPFINVICPTAITICEAEASVIPLANLIQCETLSTQLDYFPKLLNYLTVIDRESNAILFKAPKLLVQKNISSIISKDAWDLGCRYSTYSLFAPNAIVTNNKISTIANIYGVKTNTRN